MKGGSVLDAERLKKELRGKVSEEFIALIEVLLSRCIYDPYLEIPNRFYFEVLGRRELELSRRLGYTISVLFVDVDNLKKINDVLGHIMGDRYLKAVVRMIRSCIRASDLLVRWGGDEFLCLLHTDERGALIVKERIEDTVNGRKVLIGGKRIECSVSVGWAEVKDSILSAIHLADLRMYEEKKRKKDGKAF